MLSYQNFGIYVAVFYALTWHHLCTSQGCHDKLLPPNSFHTSKENDSWIKTEVTWHHMKCFQIDLKSLKTVTAVETKNFTVTQYKLVLSLQGSIFKIYKEFEEDKLFAGNVDNSTFRKSNNSCPFQSRYIMFCTVDMKELMPLFRIYGCDANDQQAGVASSSIANIKVISVTSSSIVVDLRAVIHHKLSKLYLSYSSTSQDTKTRQVTINSSSVIYHEEINNLKSCTNYSISIKCVDQCSTQNRNTFVETYASESIKPRIINAISSNPYSINITWELPRNQNVSCASKITGFLLIYKHHNKDLLYHTIQMGPNTSGRVFGNLESCTKYDVQLFSVGSNGISMAATRVVEVRGEEPLITELYSDRPEIINIKWKEESKCYFSIQWRSSSSMSWDTNVQVGQSNSYTITDVSAWTSYDVQVTVQIGNRIIKSQVKSVLVKGKIPGRPPKSVKVEALSSNTIRVSWEPIPQEFLYGNLDGYKLQYTGPSFGSKTIMPNETKVLIGNLQVDSEYWVQVAGFTKFGNGRMSNLVAVKTKGKVPKPHAPVVEAVKAISPTSIMIKWRSNESDVKEFILNIRGPSGFELNSTFEATNSDDRNFRKEVGSLEPYTVYVVCVIGKRNLKFEKETLSKCSQPKHVTTKEGEPDMPKHFEAYSYDTYVVLRWKKPKIINGMLRGYLLTLKEMSDKGGVASTKSVNVSMNVTTYNWTDLKAYCRYTADIAALTIISGRKESVIFATKEALPSEPVNVSYSLSGATILLHWLQPKSPNGIVLSYKVHYLGIKRYQASFKHEEREKLSGRSLSKKLIPGTFYTIKVSAETSKGFGKESSPLLIMIPAQRLEPPPVPKVFISSVTASSIAVNLQKYEVKNGELRAFEVVLERKHRVRRSNNGEKILPTKIGNYHQAMTLGERFYVTAKIDPVMLPMKFILGDGKNYNGYYNAPLDPLTSYKLFTRGVSRNAYGDVMYGIPRSILLPVTAARVMPENRGKSGLIVPLPVIIGVVGAFLFLIIFVIIIILYLRAGTAHRNRAKQNYSLNDTELNKMRHHSDSEQHRLLSSVGDSRRDSKHPALNITVFKDHVHKLHKNQGFTSEYSQLEMGKEFCWETAHLQENRPKNRYANIVAYDHSRVVLSTIDGHPGSDYINASYIDGFMKPNAYIATQGPLPGTFNDFWRMVWEVRSNVVIMLTNLQEKNKLKCHKYWPDENVEYGDIKVIFYRKEVYADYTIRTFFLQKPVGGGHESRQVKQFHFTVWPDHGVPDYATAILSFRRRVRAYNTAESGPYVVHCSAGVGRTGTYIAIDSMMDRLDKQGDLDIFNFIAAMRNRRIAMVQTEEQYVFVHDAIHEYVTCGNTQITAQDLQTALKKLEQINQDTRMTGFEREWKVLNNASPILPKTDFQVALLAENVNKNRYSCVVPSDTGRVRLQPIGDDEATSYINAVYVDGYKQRNAFILTQCPLPNTVCDFWRMLSEHRSASVVMLCSLEEGDDYSKFWPDSGSHDYEMITVDCIESKRGEDSPDVILRTDYDLVRKKFCVTDARDPDNQIVLELFHYFGWTETRPPSSCVGIISLVSLVEKWQQHSGNGPITIICSDGLGRSGTLAALIAVLERVKTEQVVDVFQAIKAMRIQRPHLVKSLDQYEFIHFAVQDYITAFDDYSNFK